jgi:hypothetical protein
MSSDEYERIAGYVEQTHDEWLQARNALQQHVAAHN